MGSAENDLPGAPLLPRSPGEQTRAETGPMKFGDDWTGVFIRGDNAAGYAMTLRFAVSKLSGFEAAALAGLLRLFEGSNERTSHLSDTQMMRPFAASRLPLASVEGQKHEDATRRDGHGLTDRREDSRSQPDGSERG